MIDDGRTNSLLRLASLAAFLFATLLLLQLSTARLAETNISSDSFQSVLISIGAHRMMFSLSAFFGTLAVVCLIPMMLGVWESTAVTDRPFAVMIAVLLLISGMLLVDAYAHLGNLIGVAEDYRHAVAPRDVIVFQGDTIGDQFQILQYAGLVAFGIAMLVWSWLMARSEVYPKPMSWLTWAVGLLSFAFVIQPVMFIPTLLVWAVALGVVWQRATMPKPVTDMESASS